MHGPLKGIKALDFGMNAVGPISLTYLGVLGADVIKIERPAGDNVRRGNGAAMKGMGTTFIGNNYTKRNIILDLTQERDRAIAIQLVRTADIVMDNFRSGEIMARLGLGYEVLSKVNPRIIYLQSSAYGTRGPMKGMTSFDQMTQAGAGYTSVNGAPGGLPEFSRGTARLDWNAAMLNCIGLLAALAARRKSGKGILIESNQFRSTITSGLTRWAEFFSTGEVPKPTGSTRPNIVPDQAFATALGYISISVLNNGIWGRFCKAIEKPELAKDAMFLTNPLRVEHRTELIPLLEAVFIKKAAWQWAKVMKQHGVPFGEYFRDRPETHFLMEHPQVIANQMASTIESPWGAVNVCFNHWRFGKNTTSIPRPAPMMDEHREEILRELGIDPKSAQSALGSRPVPASWIRR